MSYLSILTWQLSLMSTLRSLSNNVLDKLFSIITYLGEPYVIIAVVVIVYFYIDRKLGEKVAFTMIVSNAINNIIKPIACVVRPFNHPACDFTPYAGALESATGYAFPSGHTQIAATTYPLVGKLTKKTGLLILGIILTILVGISRVWLGVHYPTDVLVGLILGLLFSLILFNVFDKIWDNEKTKNIIFYTTLGVSLIALIVISIVNPNGDIADLYKSVFLYGGFILAIKLAQKTVPFTSTQSKKIRIIRTLLSLVFVGIVYIGLKLVFKAFNPSGIASCLCDGIRYFCVALMALWFYPFLFRKTKLFK